MKDLHLRVKRILEEDIYTRGSDSILYLKVLEDYGYKPRELSLLDMTRLVIDKAVPSVESVGRVRRKVQELHPELLPSSNVLAGRMARELMFEEYARRKF